MAEKNVQCFKMKSEEKQTKEGIELPNQEWIRSGEKENYKYFVILKADTINQPENKRSNMKIESKNKELCNRNLIKGINTKAYPSLK